MAKIYLPIASRIEEHFPFVDSNFPIASVTGGYRDLNKFRAVLTMRWSYSDFIVKTVTPTVTELLRAMKLAVESVKPVVLLIPIYDGVTVEVNDIIAELVSVVPYCNSYIIFFNVLGLHPKDGHVTVNVEGTQLDVSSTNLYVKYPSDDAPHHFGIEYPF